MIATRLLAVTVSAVLGIAGGVLSGRLIDHGSGGSDPLGLGVDMVNQSCTGQSLLVTMASRSQDALASAVAENPDTRYLEITRSCPTVWKQEVTAHGYATYLGPYSTISQACQTRMTVAHRGDLVTRLVNGSTQPVQCLCYLGYSTMPILRQSMDLSALDGIYVRALQKMLYTAGVNHDDTETGLYDDATIKQVKAFQTLKGLPANGVVNAATWHALQGRACKLYPS
ncbi:MAG: peptidoglycan-binding domain-containing protein [Nocardioides sp.]